MNKELVLASKSPRRIQLLKDIGLDFIVYPSDFIEKEEGDSARDVAIYNAIGKAQKVTSHFRNSLVIGVDTVVSFQNHIIGKPKDKEDAKRILRLLSSTTHQVITAISIIDSNSNKNIVDTETTDVVMDKLNESDIEAYINSGEGIDKAAGYAIQGKGSLYIKKINGDYFNVVGLPIFRLRKMLKEFGIKITHLTLDKD